METPGKTHEGDDVCEARGDASYTHSALAPWALAFLKGIVGFFPTLLHPVAKKGMGARGCLRRASRACSVRERAESEPDATPALSFSLFTALAPL